VLKSQAMAELTVTNRSPAGEPLFVLKSQAMAVPPTKYKKPDDADDAPLGGLQV